MKLKQNLLSEYLWDFILLFGDFVCILHTRNQAW